MTVETIDEGLKISKNWKLILWNTILNQNVSTISKRFAALHAKIQRT